MLGSCAVWLRISMSLLVEHSYLIPFDVEVAEKLCSKSVVMLYNNAQSKQHNVVFKAYKLHNVVTKAYKLHILIYTNMYLTA